MQNYSLGGRGSRPNMAHDLTHYLKLWICRFITVTQEQTAYEVLGLRFRSLDDLALACLLT